MGRFSEIGHRGHRQVAHQGSFMRHLSVSWVPIEPENLCSSDCFKVKNKIQTIKKVAIAKFAVSEKKTQLFETKIQQSAVFLF